MIEVGIQPDRVTAGVTTNAVLHVRNVDARPCTGVRVQFEPPFALRLTGGRTIEATRLGAGEHVGRPVCVNPRDAGPLTIAVPYLTYRDADGRSHYADGLGVQLDVSPAPPTGPGTADRPASRQAVRAERSSVFVSHRRADSNFFVDLLVQRLREHLTEVEIFVDHYGIPPGADFRQTLDGELARCGVMLALIGPTWLSHRLVDDDDVLRRELVVGLDRGVVLPVLFGRSRMPHAHELPVDIRKLADLQPAEVDRRHLDADLHELALVVRERLLDQQPSP